jgi:hypothetical protein
MPEAVEQTARQPTRIHPVYRSSDEGTILVYGGELLLSRGGVERVARGNLELRLSPRSVFHAHVAGSEPWLLPWALQSEDLAVAVPVDASLVPPTVSALPVRPDDATSWADLPIPINHLVAGDVRLVERLIIHVGGPLTTRPLPMVQTESGPQGQVSMRLRGWDLLLAATGDPQAMEDFSFEVEAVPRKRPVQEEVARQLRWRLFLLLSLVAGQEIGVGPVVGLDASGQVVWAEWDAPRFTPGRSAWRWCPRQLAGMALPVLAHGFNALGGDPALQAVVDRAVNHLLAANGSEVLDVRIPVACSGLELLSWAVLQRHQWLTREVIDKPQFPASASVRLLLQWAGIPVALPDHFGALAGRRARIGQPDWAAPELVFNVRNALVHPPKKIEEPEWPGDEELFEAWQLATWSLELAIMRLLGYDGTYTSRLRLNQPDVGNDEPVPWHT